MVFLFTEAISRVWKEPPLLKNFFLGTSPFFLEAVQKITRPYQRSEVTVGSVPPLEIR